MFANSAMFFCGVFDYSATFFAECLLIPRCLTFVTGVLFLSSVTFLLRFFFFFYPPADGEK